MGDPTTLDTDASTNGSGDYERATASAEEDTTVGITDALTGIAGGLTGRLAGAGRALASTVGNRFAGALHADLDERDPDYIRANLPTLWLATSIWFRGEVRNLGNIPEDRPVLLVGNHSGGNLTPDTHLLTLAFYTYFGVERAFYQLAHNLVLASPFGPILRRYGTVAASHEHAQQALREGAALLVYPGGDWEVHRPTWEGGKVDFGGRKGFIRLALNEGVPIVPVVSAGGQETALVLSRGDWLARLLLLDKLFRLKVLPLTVAPPWGLSVGDFLPRIPFPAKLTIEVLPPIELTEQFGEDPDVDEVYEHVTRKMQETLDSLYAERRYPVIG
ncbi:MAG TPA: lysophospholipid acyltransferase family protein [Solirubrobacterales bacterium]